MKKPAKGKKPPAKKKVPAKAKGVAAPGKKAARGRDPLAPLRAGFAKLPGKVRGEVDEALGSVAKSPGKAATAAKAAAKKLGQTEAAMALLDGVAAAILDSDARQKGPAGDCWAAARVIERKLGVEVDPADALALAERLAADGALWVKELVLLAKSLDEVEPARLAALAVQAVRTGEEPSAALLEALERHGAARPALRALVLEVPEKVGSADPELWVAAAPAIAALVESDEAMLDWAIGFLPQKWRPLAPWGALVRDARLSELARDRRPKELHRFCARMVGYLSRQGQVSDETLELLCGILTPVAEALRAGGETFSVRADAPGTTLKEGDPTYYPATQLLPPEAIELMLGLRLPLAAPEPGSHFVLHAWANRESALPYAKLERVGADPGLRAALQLAFRQAIGNEYLPVYLAAAVRSPGCAQALDGLIAHVALLAEQGTVGMLDILLPALGRMAQPAALRAFPALAEALASVDPVALLRRQLAGGLMDEWGWPAQDAAAERLGKNLAPFLLLGVFPHLVLHDRETGRVVVAGPEGVVFDHVDTTEWAKKAWRVAVYSSKRDDVLAFEWNGGPAHWVKSGESPFSGHARTMLDPLDGTILTSAGRDLTEPTADFEALWRSPGHLDYPGLWHDGERLYVCPRRGRLRRDGTAHEEKDSMQTYAGGESRGPALPRWMAGLLAADEEIDGANSFVVPVPPRAARGPLASANGFGGFAAIQPRQGPPRHVAIDGRSFTGELENVANYAGHVTGLMTFPEREAIYPVGMAAFDTGTYLPGGEIPLAPITDKLSSRYWGGAPQPLQPIWWHLFEPRDAAGSRALRDVSEAQARALYEAAARTLAEGAAGDRDPETALDRPGLRVTMSGPAKWLDALATWPAVAEAARETFPAITHPRLLAGLVRMAVTAAELGAQLGGVHAQVASAAGSVRQSALRNRDVSQLDRLFGEDFRMPGRWGVDLLGQQIMDVADFLFGERAPVADAERPRVQSPAPCFLPWERLLTTAGAGDFAFRVRAPGVPDEARAQMRKLLELIASTPFAAPPRAPRRLRAMHLGFGRVPFAGIVRDRADRLAEWENRYFMRCVQMQDGAWVFRTLEVSTDGVFRLPPGATSIDEIELGSASLAEALASPPLAYDEDAAARVARETGLMPASARLLVSGAAPPLELDKATRKLLSVTLEDLEHATRELAVLPLEDFYAGVEVGGGTADEVASGVSRRFVERFGRRAPLDPEIVDRMAEDIRNPHPPFQLAARALLEPEREAPLTRDLVWVHRPIHRMTLGALRFGSVPSGWPEHAGTPPPAFARPWPDPRVGFSYEVLASFLKYLSWAYLELPIGDPLRLSAHRAGVLMRERLTAPELLLPIAMGPIADRAAFERHVAALGGRAYRAGDGGKSARGIEAHGVVIVWPDAAEHRDGFFVSLRPAEVGPRTAEVLGTGAKLELPGAGPIDTFPYRALFDLWRDPGFQALCGHLGRKDPPGRWVADPRMSVPDLVASVRKKLGVSEDAAVLAIQIHALGEPTPARIARYNGWSRADYQRAAAEAVGKGAVVEAPQRSTPRLHFTGDPLVFVERFPAPIESTKLESHRMREGERPPLDVPLPCTDVETLYRRHGQRLLA